MESDYLMSKCYLKYLQACLSVQALNRQIRDVIAAEARLAILEPNRAITTGTTKTMATERQNS